MSVFGVWTSWRESVANRQVKTPLEDQMNRRSLRMAAIATAGGLLLAGCSAQGAPEDDLQRDLDRARTSAIDLLPRTGGQQVVSDVESAPAGNRPARVAPAPVRTSAKRAATPAPVRRATPRPAPEAVPVETEPAAPVDAPATPRPSSKPATQPPPPGGFKTMEEMIRKAPFPINP